MYIDMPSFDELFEEHTWQPISGCPGRYILSEGVIKDDIKAFLNDSLEIKVNRYNSVPDLVHICYFDGGGLISYEKEEGYLHTLCDDSGMKRKIEDLNHKG